ncbi:FixH family protein [Marinibacterium profundimaris]|uniref:FixH protein n=1 Tax=Marinibacterium profundimaris TaxID=1679460 RepID=A0A225NRW8_9RHOB|nr:FixH family protein [Marinibacterium profundimaris]OWU77671.1 FixH protein [Marinibacterium profundimaris]
MSEFTLKGRHVAMIFGLGFGIIIAVNLTLAYNAVRTFPGLETKNSYVASQTFNADRAAQEALGWQASAVIQDDFLVLRFDTVNGPAMPTITKATLGRATHVGEDRTPVFAWDGEAYVAHVPALGAGKWDLRLEAVADDGTRYRRRFEMEHRL